MDAGRFLGTAADLQQIVVGVSQGKPVYLRDVAASITDGASEPDDYVLYGNGAAGKSGASGDYPAVTITLAKRKGTNATDITVAAEKKIESLRGYLLPADLNVSITRNYGETAKDKSDELLKHLAIATLSVTLLIALALGWRESGVVLIAIPVTLALTLFIFYLFGYTLNRVTLFALIFSIGIWSTTRLSWWRTSCGISGCRRTAAGISAPSRSRRWMRSAIPRYWRRSP